MYRDQADVCRRKMKAVIYDQYCKISQRSHYVTFSMSFCWIHYVVLALTYGFGISVYQRRPCSIHLKTLGDRCRFID